MKSKAYLEFGSTQRIETENETNVKTISSASKETVRAEMCASHFIEPRPSIAFGNNNRRNNETKKYKIKVAG